MLFYIRVWVKIHTFSIHVLSCGKGSHVGVCGIALRSSQQILGLVEQLTANACEVCIFSVALRKADNGSGGQGKL